MFRRKRLILIGVFIFAVTSSVLFMRGKYNVPILMYHSINPASNPYMELLIVSPKIFERQMRFLKEHNYNVISLNEVAAMIKNKKKIPPKTIAITFDDGYKDNYIYAFPILKKYNLPATIFIIVNEVGRPDRLSWDDIATMQACGLITFGSHTLTHPYLPDTGLERVIEKELRDSKKILEEKLGEKVDIFCYPGGRFNPKIKEATIAAGYQAAVATKPGKGFVNDDLFALKRLRISSNAGNLFIFWIETSGYYTFISESKIKNEHRK